MTKVDPKFTALVYNKEGRRKMIKVLVSRYSLNPYELAPKLGVSVPTVYNWMSGRTVPPVYAPRAIIAAMYDMKPSNNKLTIANYENLGVAYSIMNYWRRTEQVPHLARLATSYIRTLPAE